MRPTTLGLRNFCQYRETDLDFRGHDQVAIVGLNGSGKSTLLVAITYALFGRTEQGGADDLVREGETDMWVVFEWEQGGRQYRVDRSRSYGKSSNVSFEMLNPPTRLTRRTIDETNEAIASVVGEPYETFLAANMVPQGRLDELTRRTAAKRKEVVADVLGLGLYRTLEEAARAQRVVALRVSEQALAELAKLDVELAALPEARRLLSETDVAARTLATVVSEDEAAVAVALQERERLEELERQVGVLAAEARTSAEAATRFRSTESRLLREAESFHQSLLSSASLQEAAIRLREVREKAAPLGADLAQWSQHYREADASLRSHNTRRTEVRLRLTTAERDAEHAKASAATLHRDVCATCPFVQTERERAGALETHLMTIRQLSGELTALSANDEAVEMRMVEVRRGVQKIERELREVSETAKALEPRAKQAEALAGMNDRLVQARSEAARAAEQALQLEKAGGEARRRVVGLAFSGGMLVSARNSHEAAVQRVASGRTDLAVLSNNATRLQREVERIETLGHRRPESEHLVTAARRNEAEWTYLIGALGKDGIPALIIENAVPEIEDVANDVLSGLPEQLHVKLSLRRALKSREGTVDTLDVEVSGTRTGSRYEKLSGGEKDRVDLALRIGIARVAATRYGAQIRFFAVDEALSSQDDEGIEAMLGVLAQSRRYFDFIAVVSHLNAVRDRFPSRVVCSKSERGSVAVLA